MNDDDETKEFKSGYAAYKRGEWRYSNPYPNDTDEFYEYDSGWLWAKQCDNGEN